MKITRNFAHRVELPLHETTYKLSGCKSVTVFERTIVGVETDTGHPPENGCARKAPRRNPLADLTNGRRARLQLLGAEGSISLHLPHEGEDFFLFFFNFAR